MTAMTHRLECRWNGTLVLDAACTATVAHGILHSMADPARQSFGLGIPTLPAILSLPFGVYLEGSAKDDAGLCEWILFVRPQGVI